MRAVVDAGLRVKLTVESWGRPSLLILASAPMLRAEISARKVWIEFHGALRSAWCAKNLRDAQKSNLMNF
jgi:hypothetical protein